MISPTGSYRKKEEVRLICVISSALNTQHQLIAERSNLFHCVGEAGAETRSIFTGTTTTSNTNSTKD